MIFKREWLRDGLLFPSGIVSFPCILVTSITFPLDEYNIQRALPKPYTAKIFVGGARLFLRTPRFLFFLLSSHRLFLARNKRSPLLSSSPWSYEVFFPFYHLLSLHKSRERMCKRTPYHKYKRAIRVRDGWWVLFPILWHKKNDILKKYIYFV